MKMFSDYITSIEGISKYVFEDKNKNNINIKHIIFFGSKGELGKSESNMFKDAIKKYKDIEVTYIFNLFTYFFDDTKLTIHYIEEDTQVNKTLNIKYKDNIETLFVYKSIHPKLWNEYIYNFSILLNKHFFFQLNPPHISKYANDKFLSYQLLAKNNIKQPKTVLIENIDLTLLNSDDEVLIGGNTTLYNKLGSIYNVDAKSAKDIKEMKFVVKLLNGSHGIGVFLCNGEQIVDILQAAFALDDNLKLLVQAKEETIDGDLRVHVLTLNNKQTVLAQMKRKKIKSDFRSNYSLGADIEEVELTDDQRDLAKDVAKMSGLTWCAVDIMPIKTKEGEIDNVIIEYNQNPGTEGISKVLGKNFFNILFDELFENISKEDFYIKKDNLI